MKAMVMKHHKITEQELDEWSRGLWVQFAASFGDQSQKSLEVSLNGYYRVTDHDQITYCGTAKEIAIHEYNIAR